MKKSVQKSESNLPVISNEIMDVEWEEEYFLCSAEVLEHFADFLHISEPFKSGYEFDKDEIYYVVLTDGYKEIEKYYNKVIEPFNEKSRAGTVDFWMKPITNSSLEAAPKGCITKCRRLGIFRAIEQIWNLTNESNRAFAIFKMAEYYGIDPIEFVDKIRRN